MRLGNSDGNDWGDGGVESVVGRIGLDVEAVDVGGGCRLYWSSVRYVVFGLGGDEMTLVARSDRDNNGLLLARRQYVTVVVRGANADSRTRVRTCTAVE